MNIMGDNKMSFEQVIDTCVGVPRREDIVKNDTVENPRWKPISHGSFINALATGIEHHGLEITDSAFALNKTGHLLVGGFKVKGACLPAIPSGMAAEFELFTRHANNMSRAIQLNAGLEMMACTNGQMTGECIARHKHTTGFDIDEWARDVALAEFIEDCARQVRNVEELREMECNTDQAARCILEAGSRGIVPLARTVDIWNEWKDPVFNANDFAPNTAWKLVGNMTHIAQKCSPQRQLQIVQAASPLVREFCRAQSIDVDVIPA